MGVFAKSVVTFISESFLSLLASPVCPSHIWIVCVNLVVLAHFIHTSFFLSQNLRKNRLGTNHYVGTMHALITIYSCSIKLLCYTRNIWLNICNVEADFLNCPVSILQNGWTSNTSATPAPRSSLGTKAAEFSHKKWAAHFLPPAPCCWYMSLQMRWPPLCGCQSRFCVIRIYIYTLAVYNMRRVSNFWHGSVKLSLDSISISSRHSNREHFKKMAERSDRDKC